MQWSVLRGYQHTGVTTQFMVKEMDAGDVLLQVPAKIELNETSKDLHDRLKIVGGSLLVETLNGLEAGTIAPRPQDGSKATFAPLLTKEQGLLQFSKLDASTAHNLVRGLFPWPGAYTFFHGKRVKLLRSRVADKAETGAAGEFWLEGDQLFVNCSSGILELLEIQPEGKRPILPREFGNGIKSQAHKFDSENA